MMMTVSHIGSALQKSMYIAGLVKGARPSRPQWRTNPSAAPPRAANSPGYNPDAVAATVGYLCAGPPGSTRSWPLPEEEQLHSHEAALRLQPTSTQCHGCRQSLWPGVVSRAIAETNSCDPLPLESSGLTFNASVAARPPDTGIQAALGRTSG
ncbi:hypothetical protein NDU88_001721 [Pleurodeles waltl]|uniref:Uncharacterized protein n=1 Tax=Pleurodeles waltl TaxID=8319 RepID=A0AAV7LDZ1_PLEWA|nr:hypothetical protein NDU88_001721 [Pleurodeles waltl]